MKLLSLNCQRGHTPGLKEFMRQTLEGGEYDFLLLQEYAKEVPSYVRGVGPYEVLEQYDERAGEVSQTCIVYRKGYRLLEKGFLPFVRMRRDLVVGFKHSTFGALMARFHTDDGVVLAGSTHLHSGMYPKVRAAQARKIKEQVLLLTQPDDSVIFGGDCNFGFPGERARAESLLAPEFACATRSLGPTLDSRYSENVPHLPNRVAAFFAFFNIRIPLWTDQLFVDAKTAREHVIRCRVLPDRVSDHSPLEMVIA